ncbi:hypothetical protein F4802DRAFT_596022 [Xylaria palmicola]|nr:hypothetical protein F4802DRAFT_596022 [Xylaria palmicola]
MPSSTTDQPVRSLPSDLSTTLSAYLTHDEYVDLQNKQDHFLTFELNAIRNNQQETNELIDSKFENIDSKFESIDNEFKAIHERMDRGFESMDRKFESMDRKFESMDRKFESMDRKFESIDGKFESMDSKFESMDSKFESMDKKFDGFEYRLEQFDAVFRNSRLSNPILPIYPVIAIDPVKGKQTPNPKFFPRNADQFYKLRDPSDIHDQTMLVYLVEFYDLVPENSEIIVEDPHDAMAEGHDARVRTDDVQVSATRDCLLEETAYLVHFAGI